jgi:hypothetical protein
MSESRRLKRQVKKLITGQKSKLRNVSKRIIIDTYANHVEGFINIIAAGTGVGKTYNIANELIPSDFKAGKDKFLFLTVFRDNVEQDARDLKRALLPHGIDVVKTIDEFLDSETPCCFITTLAGAVNGGVKEDGQEDTNFGTNGKLLTEYLANQNFAVYWDEAHFGGSSSDEATVHNTGHLAANYKASYYKFVEGLARFGKVTGFTATPLFEHRGLLPEKIQSDMYHFLTTKEDWATISELTEITSQTRFMKPYNPDKDGFVWGLDMALTDFVTFSHNLKLLAEQIQAFESGLKLTPKPVILLNAGAAIVDTTTSLPLDEQVEETVRLLRGKFDPDAHIFGKATKDGYMTRSLNSKWTNKTVRNFKDFIDKMLDPNDPLQFVFHLEKFKFGLNVANVTHEVHSRERNQKGEVKVTVSILQIWGRAVRTWFGIDKSMFKDWKETNNKVPNYVSDAVNWLLSNYSKSSVFEELREYMMLCNSHTLFYPKTPTYAEAVLQWNNPEMPYAAPIDRSQFHIDSDGVSLTSSVSGQERDLAYKKYKEKVRYCEEHPDGSCKLENRDKFSELTDDKFEEAYWKALHVDHISGDREDMDEENLITVCPTYHGIKTYVNGDHLNNYVTN